MEESGRHDEPKILKKRQVLYYYNGEIKAQRVPVYWYGQHYQIQSTHLSNVFNKYKYGLAWDKYAVMLIAASDNFEEMRVMFDELEEAAFTFEDYSEEKHEVYAKFLLKHMHKQIDIYSRVVPVIEGTKEIYKAWRRQQFGEWKSEGYPYTSGPLDPLWLARKNREEQEDIEAIERKAKYQR